MNTAKSQPTVNVIEGNGKIRGMVSNVIGDALPAENPVLATEMVVISC